MFEKISGFKDSDEQIKICKNTLNENIYRSAVKEYEQNSALMENEKKERFPFWSDDNTDNAVNNFKKVIEKFKDIENYKDSLDYIDKCIEKTYEIRYINANHNFNGKAIFILEAALKKFSAIKEYKDSAEMIERCREKIQSMKDEEEAEKKAKEEAEQLQRKKNNQKDSAFLFVGLTIVGFWLLCVIFAIIFGFMS